MSIVSNLYADKAFAEHPTALWSLDDAADYVSLLTNSQRNVYNWTTTNCHALEITNVKNEPFFNSSTTRINIDVIPNSGEGEELNCLLQSDQIINFEDLQVSLGTFAISTYVYTGSPYITGYELGYEYYNNATGSWHEITKIFNIAITERWLFLSETFAVPEESGPMRLVFKPRFLSGYTEFENYVLVNGFSCGQWSEEFASTSLGIQPIQLPSGIFDETTYGYPARTYGLQENNGYYLINKKSLLAKNSGAPMVYGSQNCTVIYPNENKPSLVLPSMGFLNEVGKYKTYTIEMWLRVNSNTTEPKKIFGNIEDDNGLYVDGPFLILKIGNKIISHYIGEWTRPMLVHILYLDDSFKLYINGEEVGSVYQKTKEINFTSSKQWLGFWAYEDASPIELDCFGIYPYKVSNIVAKRRFVFGQGVEDPDNINTAYNGRSLLIDYSVADYSNNYSYPNIGKWSQGVIDNLTINNNILSTPTYNLPTITTIDSLNVNAWTSANSLIQTEDLSIGDYISALNIDPGLYNKQLWDILLDGGTASNIIGVDRVDAGTSILFDNINDHTASYTLVASEYLNEYALDIDVVGYWEDYQPLTYYAQYVEDLSGSRYYDLDFLQFNIDYPAPSKFYEIESTGEEWSYAQLYNLYNYPRKRNYESLDNFLFTGYRNYEDLQYNKTRTYKYDTTKSQVRSYVTFQYVKNGANSPAGFFTKIEPPAKEGTVEPNTDWIYTKYEVIDNMIIYPPSGVDFNDLAVVTHLEFKTQNILRNKVKLRKLEYCSQAFNQSNNPIGTMPYEKMYPYKKSGIYYSYKGKNPYSIYKNSSPYLYMTRTSGIQLRGKFDPLINRGLLIPINKNKTSKFDKIMAMQIAIRFDDDYFPYAPTQIFEIEAKNSYIKFYMVATDQTGQRAKIYGINANTGRLEDGIAFYLNGNIVKDPVITNKQWSFLGISFSNLLDISGYSGSIKLNGPLLFNNISYYQSTNLQEVQKVSTRPWFQVKRSGPLLLDWEYWTPNFFLWQGVLVASSISYYGVNPDDIYQSYVGTNKLSTGSDKIFSIGKCEYDIYQDILWKQSTQSAV